MPGKKVCASSQDRRNWPKPSYFQIYHFKPTQEELNAYLKEIKETYQFSFSKLFLFLLEKEIPRDSRI